MTSLERVRAALEHREADRVPVDFGAMPSTGISAIAYNRLKTHLGLRGGETRVYDIYQQLAEPEEPVLRRLGADVVQLYRCRPAFGITLDSRKNPPYAEVRTKADIDAIPLEEMDAEEEERLKVEARSLRDNSDYAILGAFGGGALEAGQADWGWERFLTALALEPDLVRRYLERLADVHMRDLERYLSAVGDCIDLIEFCDDLGGQEGSLISREMYRELIMPCHARQFAYVRGRYPRVKVLLHSCGAIRALIPDLIEAGVEVLNPVQLSARGMDPAELKREFGEDLVFWGGGLDTRSTLADGTVGDIERGARELLRVLAPGGGFVFAPTHSFPADAPPEEVVAFYDGALAAGAYPIAK